MTTSLSRLVLVPAALASLALPLAACGSDGPSSASDPAAGGGTSTSPAAPATPEPPTAVPAAPGPVRSADLPTVMDTGDGAQLCLGAIAESYPPQCAGPAIPNWDWKSYQGTFEQQGEVRWGTYAVTGTWDGSAFTVADAITGALYDPAMPTPVELPEPSKDLTDAELADLSDSLADVLPGYQGSYPDDAGHVLVDVLYDDGSLQDYADEAYGAGVVVVSGQLVDVEG